MDSFELNKIIGAILGTLLFVMGIGFLAEGIYTPIKDNGPGYELPGAPDEPSGDTTTPEAAVVSIGTLLASASATEGEKSAKKCLACHDFNAGGPNKTGPNLYDVVERLIGSHEGFAYSAGMEEHKAKGDTWTYENLNAFITTPKAFTPGTKMTFAGVKNDQERANIIAYLATLSASPKPFPPADAAASETPAVDAPAMAPASDAMAPAADAMAPAADIPAAETPADAMAPAAEAPAASN